MHTVLMIVETREAVVSQDRRKVSILLQILTDMGHLRHIRNEARRH